MIGQSLRFTSVDPPGCDGSRNPPVDCWACGVPTRLLVSSHGVRPDDTQIRFGVCPCARQEPMVVTIKNGAVTMQAPAGRAMSPGERWPDDLTRLFGEAAASFGAGAYTASAMVSRKILMVLACKEGAEEDRSFAFYVDYILANVASIPKAKATVNKVRLIGNDATHEVRFVPQDDAKTALEIAHHLLSAVYTLTTA